MILVDFNGLTVGTIISQKAELKEDVIRHIILNLLRQYNVMFREQYGDMVICCEGRSWRKNFFPHYKAARKKGRETSSVDWDEVYRIMNLVTEELVDHTHYKVVRVENAEADDIIGVLTEQTQDFGKHEPVMILSADKDFIQLHKYDNVKQYSPMQKKYVKDDNPRTYLLHHIIKGDSSDGIPNILSADDTFVTDARQSPARSKFIQEFVDYIDRLDDYSDREVVRNYQRNRKLIDLSLCPDDIKYNIINTHDQAKVVDKSNILNYLIKKRCKMLIECVEEFY